MIFEVYKLKERLLEGDTYLSKPKIAVEMIRYLHNLGFKFKLILADSLYGESHSTFIKVLNELQLNYVVAILSNHGVWLPQDQTVRQNRWRTFDRIFSDSSKQTRYIREIVFGRQREVQYWLIITDLEKLPENSTWYVMTKILGVKFKEVGNTYGLRNWIEYGLKQSKNELGWADFRFTDYCQISNISGEK